MKMKFKGGTVKRSICRMAYLSAVEDALGSDIDYAMLQKIYSNEQQGDYYREAGLRVCLNRRYRASKSYAPYDELPIGLPKNAFSKNREPQAYDGDLHHDGGLNYGSVQPMFGPWKKSWG